MDKKPTAYIFGAGSTGMRLLPRIERDYEVLGFVDNNSEYFHNVIKTGNEEISGKYGVYSPERVSGGGFDRIVIASLPGFGPITAQLMAAGVDARVIDGSYVEIFVKSRILFLERLAGEFRKSGKNGAVAEGGVLQGDFAKEINRVFFEKTFYLFDTFDGFPNEDAARDREKGFSEFLGGHLKITSQELVESKLPYPEKCVFKKGYFPDTAVGVDNTFCFVNLDFDLYNPTLSGLEFFYPRMVPGGVILIHDYFNEGYRGVEQAVREFSDRIDEGLRLMPIGDDYSIAVLC